MLNANYDDMSMVNHSPIKNCPEDVIGLIFSDLGCKELGKLMLVSQDFNKNANQPLVWKATLLKQMPNFLDKYPYLKTLSVKEVGWKKIYFEEGPVNLKYWEGPHNVNIAILRNTRRGCVTKKENINLNLSSDKMTLRVFKQIAIELLKYREHPNEINVLLCSHFVLDSDNTVLKDIKIKNTSCLYPTFMDTVGKNEPHIFIQYKKSFLLPSSSNWVGSNKELSLPIKEEADKMQEVTVNQIKVKKEKKQCNLM